MLLIIVGIFLLSSTIGATVIDTKDRQQKLDISDKTSRVSSLAYTSNQVYLGRTWTTNDQDFFVGDANLAIDNQTVEWIVEPYENEALGIINMDIFKFIFNDKTSTNNTLLPPLWDRYSSYEITIYDGESPYDQILLERSVSFTGGGIIFGNISSFLSVDTEDEPSRTLAFRLTSRTQTYSPLLRFNIQGKPGLKSKLGKMTINFISPNETLTTHDLDEQPTILNEISHKTVDFNVGAFDLKTPYGNPSVPSCILSMSQNEQFKINKSAVVRVNAIANYTISLTQRPEPPRLSFLPCVANFQLTAVSREFPGDRLIQITSPIKKRLVLIGDNLNCNGSIPLSFDIDTEVYPNNVVFHLTYTLTPFPFSFPVDDENARLSDFNYIFWDYS